MKQTTRITVTYYEENCYSQAKEQALLKIIQTQYNLNKGE